MAMIRKCVVDGIEYEYCPHCNAAKKEQWRMIYCSENCKGIHETFRAYQGKKITKEEAQEKLGTYSVPALEKFQEYMKPIMEELLKKEEFVAPYFSKKNKRRNYQPEVAEIIVNENLDPEPEVITEEVVAVEPTEEVVVPVIDEVLL